MRDIKKPAVSRRGLLSGGAAVLWVGGNAAEGRSQTPHRALSSERPPAAAAVQGPADHTIRIAAGLVELGPEAIVSTRLYNGQFPGPLLRLTEGKPVVVDIHNDTDTPELLHWHGQFVSATVDGAAEEGSPLIPPHGMQRVAFTPGPSGFRFYHSHVAAGIDLSAGTYSGQFGPVYIEPRRDAGAYDREIFLTLKEFGPFFTTADMDVNIPLAPGTHLTELVAASTANGQSMAMGYEVGYAYNSINGRMLGNGEPLRVKEGERVLLHVLNASATMIRNLALPSHVFEVVALDGNPVPNPTDVPVLWIGPAERISAIVEMRAPGVWVLGDLVDEDRKRGMGIVVEYAGKSGEAQWQKPKLFNWDYRRFANPDASAGVPPDETIEMLFTARPAARDGFTEFAINGVSFSMEKMEPLFRLARGRRYRIHMRNGTDDVHPIHLHRNSFEITSIAGKSTSGVIKDVALIGNFQEMTIDFNADQPGLSLFHCHMQHHMDFGFMALFDCPAA